MVSLFFQLFSIKSVIKSIAVVGLLTALFFLLRSFWREPERWNASARSYVQHIGRLTADSTYWHTRSIKADSVIASRDSVIVVRDSTINLLTDEAKRSLDYAKEWQGKYNDQVAESDATANQLTDREAELSYYKALAKNGTLSLKKVGPIENLEPQNPNVVRAGLNTANREALSSVALTTLSATMGRIQSANDRMAKGLRLAGDGIAGISKKAKANASKGGVWPFNVRRKKEQKQLAVSADSLQKKVEEVSEMEHILNKQ